jgi:hypothetical protein
MFTHLSIRRLLATTSDIAGFLVVCGLFAGYTTSADAQVMRRSLTVDAQGRMASSISIAPQSSHQPKPPCGETPFSPGPQISNHSFTSPGAQNLPGSNWSESRTAWTQPQPNWGSSWSHLPTQVAEPARVVPTHSILTPAGMVTASRPAASTLSNLPLPRSLLQSTGNLITIAMPEFEQGDCPYVLRDEQNSWNYVIRPGKQQQFPEDRVWAIEFHAGNAGSVGYRLEAGQYEFRRTTDGWNLFRVNSPSSLGSLAAAPSAPF